MNLRTPEPAIPRNAFENRPCPLLTRSVVGSKWTRGAVLLSLAALVLVAVVWGNTRQIMPSPVVSNPVPTPRNPALLQAAESGTLHQPALVEFHSDFCESCRAIQGPMLDLDRRFDGRVQFIYMDIDLDATQRYIQQFHALALPTIVLLDRHGHVASNIPGWPGEEQIAHELDILVAQP